MSFRRRLRWGLLEPWYPLAAGYLVPIAMVVAVGRTWPQLGLPVRILIAALVSSIGVRLLSEIDGFGRFPQHHRVAGVKVDATNMDEIETEPWSVIELFVTHAFVGTLVGLALAI